MNADRFDAVARALPFGGSRRYALRHLFGGGLAGLFLAHATEAEDAEAKNKNQKRPALLTPIAHSEASADSSAFVRRRAPDRARAARGPRRSLSGLDEERSHRDR